MITLEKLDSQEKSTTMWWLACEAQTISILPQSLVFTRMQTVKIATGHNNALRIIYDCKEIAATWSFDMGKAGPFQDLPEQTLKL